MKNISLFSMTFIAVIIAIIAGLVIEVSVDYALGAFALGYFLVFCKNVSYGVFCRLIYKCEPRLNLLLSEEDAVNAMCKKDIKWFTAVNVLALAIFAYQFM